MGDDKKKKISTVPHPIFIILIIVAIASIATHFIPVGVYDRVTNSLGKMAVVPGSFHLVKSTPVTLLQFLTAFPRAFIKAGDIIAMTFFAGGSIAVLRKTGLITLGIEYLARKCQNNKTAIIPVMMLGVCCIDTLIGMPELYIVYLTITYPLMLRLGFDSLVAAASIMCGGIAGFSCGIANPYTVVIGQKMSDLPIYSGSGYRFICMMIMYAIAVIYVMRYARKVLKNPQISPTYEADQKKRENIEVPSADKLIFTKRFALETLYCIVVLAITFNGLINLGWDLPEMCGLFFLMGFGGGLIGGLHVNEIFDDFINGCKEMVYGVIMIAAGTAVSVVMADGNITDAIVNALSNGLQLVPRDLSVIGIFLAVTILNFFNGSGSGKAVVLFPMLVPLADVLGIHRQVMVLAYQFGDGFSNILYPNGGSMNVCTGYVGVAYPIWLKFYLPLFAIWYVAGFIMLIAAQWIGLGPF
ncbi:MAG: AbgT family transporter [Acidaminococcus sp.]|jgi:uncharacterized ion transporter superfamily protein YfcC|nr:AbgT family transporter [Acidaminococcus sp.]MCI2114422.1 AbgT family transporter [Acidaminococcus sp.]MCI2116189.1 AbgT family transporter [Acidaminococcus sp.]